jgi:hypothetical protein
MKIGPAKLWLWLLFGMGCAEPPTQLLVSVDSDLTPGKQLASLEVAVYDVTGEHQVKQETYRLTAAKQPAPGEYRLPLSFGVVPRQENELRLVVNGYDPEGTHVVERKLITEFQRGKKRRVELFLSSLCFGNLCSGDQTCYPAARGETPAGECGPAAEGSGSVPPPEAGMDASEPDAEIDGGPDADEPPGPDADESPGLDADMRPGLAVDASPDADASPAPCAAGFERVDAGCQDIDECQRDNGGCARRCLNTDGGHVCCSAGYKAASDGRGCALFEWKKPFALDKAAGPAMNPRVALNTQGQAVVSWEMERSTDHYDAWFRRYRLDDSWSEPELLADGAISSARVPQIGIDDAGNAFAAWHGVEPPKLHMWMRRQVAGGGWGMLERSTGGLWNVPSFQLQVGAASAARVSVERYMNEEGVYSGPWTVFADQYRGYWSRGNPIFKMEPEDQLTIPRVALGGQGTALAVWSRLKSGSYDVLFSRGAADNTWSVPALVPGFQGATVHVAADGAGHAFLAAITPVLAPARRLAVTRYDPAHEPPWTEVREFGEAVNDDVELYPIFERTSFDLAANARGDAVVVWEQVGSAGMTDIWALRYDVAGAGWQTPVKLENDDRGSAQRPRVALDPDGNAIAIWQQFDGTRFNIWFNRYVPGRGWETPGRLEDDDVGSAEHARVALDGAGRGLAVWDQTDGVRLRIMASWLR